MIDRGLGHQAALDSIKATEPEINNSLAGHEPSKRL